MRWQMPHCGTAVIVLDRYIILCFLLNCQIPHPRAALCEQKMFCNQIQPSLYLFDLWCNDFAMDVWLLISLCWTDSLVGLQTKYLPVEYCLDKWSCCSLINIFIITTFIKSFIKHKLILQQTTLTMVTIKLLNKFKIFNSYCFKITISNKTN